MSFLSTSNHFHSRKTFSHGTLTLLFPKFFTTSKQLELHILVKFSLISIMLKRINQGYSRILLLHCTIVLIDSIPCLTGSKFITYQVRTNSRQNYFYHCTSLIPLLAMNRNHTNGRPLIKKLGIVRN